MTAFNYFLCAFVALVGSAIHFVWNMNESRKLAKTGNYIWTERTYLLDQKWAIVGSLLWITFLMLVFSEAMAKYMELSDWKRVIFGVLGYGGDSIANKVLGRASDRALAVIDNKTTQIDLVNNTSDQPTPAVMPKDKK
jgi:hypothetical protein